MFEMFGPRIF